MSERGHGLPVNISQRYDTIQALRFAAAFLVLITHSMFYVSDRLDPEFSVWKGGTVGVDIFFVISGFVMMITAPPLVAREDGWRYFVVRRLVRIVPMYWIGTTVKIAMVLVLPGIAINSALNPAHVLSSYIFLPSRNEMGDIEPVLGVGWTLIFEMFFYAVFALALLVRANPYIFASVVMTAFAAGYFLRAESGNPVWAYYFDTLVFYFVIGMTIAKLTMNPVIRRSIPYLISGLVLLVVTLVLLGMADWSFRAGFRMIVVAALVLTAVWAEPFLGKYLPKWMLFLGDASYSLYLFHPLVAPAVPAACAILGISQGWLAFLGAIGVAIACAVLIYRFIEKPLTSRLRRLPYAGRVSSRAL